MGFAKQHIVISGEEPLTISYCAFEHIDICMFEVIVDDNLELVDIEIALVSIAEHILVGEDEFANFIVVILKTVDFQFVIGIRD